MRRSRLLAGTFVAALVVLPSTGWADATAEGAEQIRRDMTTWIDRYLHVQQAERRVVVDGAVQVEPRGDHYTVLTPPIRVTTDRRSVLTIDPIRIELTPEADGRYDTTVTLPDRLTGRTAEGAEEGVVTIGDQHIRGTFVPEFQTFLNLDARINNIAVRSMREPGQLTIAAVIARMESNEIAPGTYDSQIDTRVQGLAFTDARNQSFEIGEVGVSGTVDNIRLAEYVTFARALQDLMNDTAAERQRGPSPEFLRRLSELLQRTPTLLNGVELTYSFDNLRVVEPNTRVELGGGTFGIQVEGLEAPTSTIGLTTTLGAIGITPTPPFSQFIPIDSAVGVRVSGLPNQQLLGILQTFLQSSTTMGPDRAGQMAALQLQQVIMTGGARVEITEVHFATDKTRLHLVGEVVPDPRAQMGITARATMEVAGLPELITDLQTVPDSQQAVQALTAIQAVGTPGTADDGTAIRRYEFVIGPQGAPTLNGTDITPLIAPLSGRHPGPNRPQQPTRPERQQPGQPQRP